MFLKQFYTEKDCRIFISPQQASEFAKTVASDFNPIHNPDSKQFCVPGDLLFSLVLDRYGLSKEMTFMFSGMVGGDLPLVFPKSKAGEFSITDDQNKSYLEIERHGDILTDNNSVSELVRSYVAFSGKNFPDILVPLLSEQGVMLNPKRPLVIYQSMSLSLENFEIAEPTLTLTKTILDVKGKKGLVLLNFCIRSSGRIVGTGVKKLIVRGLQDYRQAGVDQLVSSYLAYKEQWSSERSL